MNIREVYEKYKHLDKWLSDSTFRSYNPEDKILYDLWQAIKAEAKGKT